MKDFLYNELNIGDIVTYYEPGMPGEMNIGRIEKINEDTDYVAVRLIHNAVGVKRLDGYDVVLYSTEHRDTVFTYLADLFPIRERTYSGGLI